MSDGFYLFKGCLIPTRLPYLEASSKYVLERIGVDVVDLPGATCCVEPIGLKTIASDTWLVTVARMLAIAERDGRDVLTLCNGCYLSFIEAVHKLKDEDKLVKANSVLEEIGLRYEGKAWKKGAEKGLLRSDARPGFATPTGKFEIASTILREHGYDALPVYTEPREGPLADPALAARFPLVFNSGSRRPAAALRRGPAGRVCVQASR